MYIYVYIYICIYLYIYVYISNTHMHASRTQLIPVQTCSRFGLIQILDITAVLCLIGCQKNPKKNHFKLETACYCNSLAAAESNQ